jgi:chromate transporter
VAEPGRVRELAVVFGRLGCVAFGGPAAHIAMMHDEVVRRRAWLSEQRFLDLVGATNLLPGPNSTELAIYLGYERARWRGLFVAGVCFIAPAAVLVCALAWAYVRYGRTPVGAGLLYGINPVVIAIIAYAVARLASTAVRGPWLAELAVAAVVAYLAGINELVVLAGGGLLAVLVAWWRRWRAERESRAAAMLPLWLAPLLVPGSDGRLTTLFLTMLKIGSVLYGSGYVLFAFLRGDFVSRLGWLTEQQLLDAVAVGQLTPGPLFTSATFVGYLVAGLPGAVLATIAIFTPAFVFAALLGRIVSWLRGRWWASAALDGINATALALMLGVAFQLGRLALTDALTGALAVVALLALWRFRLNSAWLILAGAAVGLAHLALT